MEGLLGVVGGHTARVTVGHADVGVTGQVGVRVMTHHVLLPPHERRHADLHAATRAQLIIPCTPLSWDEEWSVTYRSVPTQ